MSADQATSGLVARSLHQVRLFFIALQFFTRIPIPHWVGFESAWLHQSARYFPAVGIVVAAVTGAVYLLASMLWPQPVAVLLSTIAGIYLTGAFHEDGFADVCDGFGGGMTPERILDIMKDSRVGAYGVIGIALMLALKCVTLAMLPSSLVIVALLIAHPLSRLAAASLILLLDYAKENGKAKPMAQQMSRGEFTIAVLSAVLPALGLILMGTTTWLAIAIGIGAAALSTLWLARFFVRHIGGYTGDCLGTVQQVAEVVLYLSLAACVQHGLA